LRGHSHERGQEGGLPLGMFAQQACNSPGYSNYNGLCIVVDNILGAGIFREKRQATYSSVHPHSQ